MKQYAPHCSSVGSISANIVALAVLVLAPFFGFVGLALAILALFLEKNSGFVKYSAALGLLFWALRAVLTGVLSAFQGFVTVGRNIFSSVFGFGLFQWGGNVVLSLLRAAVVLGVMGCIAYAAYQAYHWKEWQPPALGRLADEICKLLTRPLYTGEGPVPGECKLKNSEKTSGTDENAPGTPDEGKGGADDSAAGEQHRDS